MTDVPYEEGKLTKFYSISDLRGYLYHTEWPSFSPGYWGYHCIEHYDRNHYDACQPEIVKISNTKEDLERYSEILYYIWTHDPKKKTKYDVYVDAVRVRESIPHLGLEAIEMSDYYKVEHNCDDTCTTQHDGTSFKHTSGLFIYNVESDSPCDVAGFEIGDIIKGVFRPEVEKMRPALWKPMHLDYEDEYEVEEAHVQYRHYVISKISDMMSVLNVLHDKERVIFEIVRNGKEMQIEMNVPFHKMTVQVWNPPKIVIKRVAMMGIENGHMFVRNTGDENTEKLYLKMKAGIDVGAHELWLEIPETLIGVDFYINKKGELYVEYHV